MSNATDYPDSYHRTAEFQQACAANIERDGVSQHFPFKSMSDVRAANKELGHHFFERGQMRYWSTKIESKLFAGFLFITSEITWEDQPRRYSVRYVTPSGDVRTMEGAHQLDTLDEARQVARDAAKDVEEEGFLKAYTN